MKKRKGQETKGAKGEKGQKGEKGEKGEKGVKGVKGVKGAKGRSRRRRRVAGVPPAESSVWPEEYRGKRWKSVYAHRGKRWKSVYAVLFAGRCQLCAYSCALPKSRRLLDQWRRATRLLLCTNHPADPGELREVLPVDTCRNFKAKCWKRPRARLAQKRVRPTTDEIDVDVRRIPLGHSLFAVVDAADYEAVSKYKWYANRQGRNAYAICHIKGRVVCMNPMIMRPPKRYVVDHIDGNGLNNCRSNLRICTRRQNLANRGPCGGSSRFVGVNRQRDKWQAAITCRGEFYYLGLYADEVEAAKVRDRKAYELHGDDREAMAIRPSGSIATSPCRPLPATNSNSRVPRNDTFAPSIFSVRA